MAEDRKNTKTSTKAPAKEVVAKPRMKAVVVEDNKTKDSGDTSNQGGRGGRGRRQGRRREREEDEMDSRIIKVRRVSRMYKGGRRMRLSVFVVVGDHKGHVGAAVGKGADVGEARKKAIAKAKKNMVSVPLKGNTIPHTVEKKHKASQVLIKPAAPGTGIVAGATVKAVLELVGVEDALTKVFKSNNQINVAYAAIAGLSTLRATRL